MNRARSFELILSVALAITATTTQATVLRKIWLPDSQKQAKISMPEQFGSFKRWPDPVDKTSNELIQRTYVSGKHYIRVYLRQSNWDGIHDFRVCLLANDFQPIDRGVVVVSSDARRIFQAQLIETKGQCDSLLWFQIGDKTAAERWGLRTAVLSNIGAKLPVCREFRIVTNRTTDPEEDFAGLKEFAVLLRDYSRRN